MALPRRAALPIAVGLLLAGAATSSADEADGQPPGLEWIFAINEESPDMPPLLVLSPDGSLLAAGTPRGSVFLIATDTGSQLSAVHGDDRGEVRQIHTDHHGTRVVTVHADGYLEALDTRQGTPLLTVNPRTERADPRLAALLSPDGAFLIVAKDGMRLYHAVNDPPQTAFTLIGSNDHWLGPHLFMHPIARVFFALDDTGTFGVFTYNEATPRLLNTPARLPHLNSDLMQVAFSADGTRLATLEADGRILRYRIAFGDDAEFHLEYRGRLERGTPQGITISSDGNRLMAWSDRALLWAQGNNENVPPAEATATRTASTQVFPPLGTGNRFLAVAADANLSHVAVSQQVDGAVRLAAYAFPGARPGSAPLTVPPRPPMLLSADGSRAFAAHAAGLAAWDLTLMEYPAAADILPQDTGGLLLPPSILLGAGGALLIILLALLAVFLLARRGGREDEILAALQLEAGPLASSSTQKRAAGAATTSGAGRHVRRVTPSAPPTAAPPEGILVLDDLHIPGMPAMKGLKVAFARPAVVRLRGSTELLERFAAALTGRRAAHGIAAVAGTDRKETPTLFAQQLQDGLPAIKEPQMTSRALHAARTEETRTPLPVATRRLEADLGWMAARLEVPYARLPSIEQWKVRLALAFLHRPRVLLHPVHELPPLDDDTEEVVRRVLAAVARHHAALILLLDTEHDGAPPPAAVRALAEEELRLTENGFTERHLLEKGDILTATTPGKHHAATRGRFARTSPGTPATRNK